MRVRICRIKRKDLSRSSRFRIMATSTYPDTAIHTERFLGTQGAGDTITGLGKLTADAPDGERYARVPIP